ncbi:MAG: hypothetical protein ACPKNR_11220 [Pleomorphochaeta sp.]
MKKVSTLLLTGLLGTGMVFAGFSGTATLTNTLIDFSDNSFGFANTTELDATIDIAASTAEMVGEGDIYAEINASLNIPVTIDETADGTSPAISADDINITFDSANIVGDGWKVSILGPNGPADYAADTIALDDDDDAYNYSVAGNTVDGVAVTLDDLGSLSVGYTGDFDTLSTTKAYVAYEAPEMEVAEGLTAQVAVAGLLDTVKEAAASAKVAYASDSLSASVAVDAGKDATGYNADVVANVAVAPLTIDAYFGTVNTNSDFDFGDTAIAAATTNLLNAKVVADLNEFDVPATLTVTGLDLVNVQDLDAKVSVDLTDELSAYVSGGYVLVGGAWTVGAGATYAVDAYTAAADVSYDGAAVAASASIESTTLVNGATLTLEWADGDDIFNGTLGAVTASCTMEF